MCNAGFTTGYSREMLLDLFLPHAKVEEVVLLPGKSFSFVSLDSPQAADSALSAIHGKPNDKVDPKAPLYLALVDRVPELNQSERAEVNFEQTLPKGLTIIENYVSEEEEAKIAASLDWQTEAPQGMKHRQV